MLMLLRAKIGNHRDTQTTLLLARIGETHRQQDDLKSLINWTGGQSHREQGDFISPVPPKIRE
jgi:hypothetical protein